MIQDELSQDKLFHDLAALPDEQLTTLKTLLGEQWHWTSLKELRKLLSLRSGWTSIEQALPPVRQQVLVKTDERTEVARFYGQHFETSEGEILNVNHWSALPLTKSQEHHLTTLQRTWEELKKDPAQPRNWRDVRSICLQELQIALRKKQ